MVIGLYTALQTELPEVEVFHRSNLLEVLQPMPVGQQYGVMNPIFPIKFCHVIKIDELKNEAWAYRISTI